jgi:copper chaperone CopZ
MADKQEARFHVEGMHCAGCVTRVTKALKKLPAVDVQDVKVGSAVVLYEPSSISPQVIADAINRIGFQAGPER